ncbi:MULTISPECIES: SIS domain-containing protein [Undibacterium]|uniref:SIS domain-containing protein n=2 Tax=Undibacterium TaxID=401469 RepID=A0A941DIB2_9BURK|nr:MULTISPECIES: SIS domain-containing protein [Undibacterium]MBR7781288.1 SIS domain-containing protein [Undibacterium luofuense]GGX31376.1 regulatory protein [Undibacterium squillarum]
MATSLTDTRSSPPNEKGLLARIRIASTALSRAERQVAEFLLQKPHDALEMSIRVLAQACDVSEPTVARFSQSLGFDGFKSFKLAFAKSLATGIPYLHLDVNQADQVRDVLPKVFDRTIAALMEARNNANIPNFEAAVNLLARARRIECYGLGYSGALATDAQLKFFRFGIPTTVFCDAHLQAQSASLLNSDCVVVAFSRTGRTRDLIHSVQIAKNAGARVLVLCASGGPLADLADVHLSVDVEEDPDVYTPMTSRLAHLTYIDALAVAVTLLRGPAAIDMLEKVKSSISAKRVQQE